MIMVHILIDYSEVFMGNKSKDNAYLLSVNITDYKSKILIHQLVFFWVLYEHHGKEKLVFALMGGNFGPFSNIDEIVFVIFM